LNRPAAEYKSPGRPPVSACIYRSDTNIAVALQGAFDADQAREFVFFVLLERMMAEQISHSRSDNVIVQRFTKAIRLARFDRRVHMSARKR
jgi:hypothetical protein